jgi:hypothetical protein
LDYFTKWGWYPSIVDVIAKGKPWKIDWATKLNVHKAHIFIAHRIDKQKLKAELRQRKGVTKL